MQYIKEISYLIGKDKLKLAFLLFLFLLMSSMEAIGIGMIVPYVSLIIDPNIINSDEYSIVANLLSVFQYDNILVPMGIILVGIFFIKVLGLIIINWIIFKYCYNKSVLLKSALMKSYQNMPYINYIERNSAEYIYNMSLVDEFSIGVLASILRMIAEFFVGIFIFILLFYQNPIALMILLLLLVFSGGIYDYIFKARVKGYGRLGNIYSTNFIKGINEGIGGLKEIRVLGKNNYFYQKIHTNAKKFSEVAIKFDMVSVVPRYLLEIIMISFIVILVLYYTIQGEGAEKLLPTLAMIALAAVRLLPSSSQFIIGLNKLRFSRHGISLLYKDFKAIEDLQATDKVVETIKSYPFLSIEMKNISFRYPSRDTNVINSLSMKITAGESIGIIGISGSGKTTLLDILLGLLDVQSGEIVYNNKSLHDCLNEWRGKVAYLPQQVFIVDDTLCRNIALGEQDSNIDENRLASAIQQAKLSKLVELLPDGINTTLGDKGIQLSGGQQQRIALARAFYHEREVLVMDEATSALDNETEIEIVNEIKHLKGKKTLIIIAHRLSTVKHCDYIYRMDNGRIIEKGEYMTVVGDK